MCSGNDTTNGRHVEISKMPVRKECIDLTADEHALYKGDFVAFADDLFDVQQPLISTGGCWRSNTMLKRVCNGVRKDL